MTKTKPLYPSPWDDLPAPAAPRRATPVRRLPTPPAARPPATPPQRARGTFWQGVQVGLLAVSATILLGALAALGLYAYYARTLPSPRELYARANPYRSTRLYDRQGRLLFEVFDPLAGRRTVVTLDELPYAVIASTVATEDASFYSHLGVNPKAILWALYQNLRQDEVTFGGSTITQQVAKMVLLSPERSLARKIQDAILATELTRTYSKDEILEVYLNESYYGNLAYGIFAAAETYYGKPAAQLELHEAALLAGILQSPALYDPYTEPEAALGRRNYVLHLMARQGYITDAQRAEAAALPLGVREQSFVMEAPHMVVQVRQELERLYGTDLLYKGGLQVYTTLDLDVQHRAEQVARQRMAELAPLGATNAALVALDPRSGDVLAMLGSVDFWSTTIDGQVNVATSPRQPGSTVKPFVYLAALERGWSPATMLMDVAQDFGGGPGWPANYDLRERGPVSMRTALGSSLNIPVVYALQQVGMAAYLDAARRVGLNSLADPGHDLSAALGTTEVTLFEMTGAYGTLANGGRRVTPRTILRITDQAGNVLLGEEQPSAAQVMDPRHAYMLTDILADNAAREPVFGADSPLVLPIRAAAKTGTTDDYRDSLAIGYTADLAVGVWVGNNTGAPMQSLSGMRGAAYIWHDFMVATYATRSPEPFVRPQGLADVTVCTVSGLRPTDDCSTTRSDLFLSEALPEACSVHQRVRVCTATGERATEYCPPESVREEVVSDYGEQWDAWARSQGLLTPPRADCTLHTTARYVQVYVSAARVSGAAMVLGSADIPDMAYYVVHYGAGYTPQSWNAITPQLGARVRDGMLCVWDTTGLPAGIYSLRLTVVDRHGQQYEARTTVEVLLPTPMPQPDAPATAIPIRTVRPRVTPTPGALPPSLPGAEATAVDD